jgi:hypothetical protein
LPPSDNGFSLAPKVVEYVADALGHAVLALVPPATPTGDGGHGVAAAASPESNPPTRAADAAMRLLLFIPAPKGSRHSASD